MCLTLAVCIWANLLCIICQCFFLHNIHTQQVKKSTLEIIDVNTTFHTWTCYLPEKRGIRGKYIYKKHRCLSVELQAKTVKFSISAVSWPALIYRTIKCYVSDKTETHQKSSFGSICHFSSRSLEVR